MSYKQLCENINKLKKLGYNVEKLTVAEAVEILKKEEGEK